MENFPKRKRGRPRKIPEPMVAGLDVPEASREYFAEVVRTDRTHANAYYAEMAREVVEKFVEDLKGETLIKRSGPSREEPSGDGLDPIAEDCPHRTGTHDGRGPRRARRGTLPGGRRPHRHPLRQAQREGRMCLHPPPAHG